MVIKLFILSIPFLLIGCSASYQSEKQKTKENLLTASLTFNSNTELDTNVFKWSERKGSSDSATFIEGDASLKLSEKESHAKIAVKRLKAKRIYKVSYWTKQKSVLKIITTKEKKHTTLWATRTISKKDGWEQKECLVHLPMLDDKTKVEIVIWKPKNKIAWVDDLHIQELKKVETDDLLKLKIKGEEFENFQTYREKAAHKAIIATENKKWVKGSLNGIQTKLKLKGDWTDHIKEGIWSKKLSSKEELLPGLKSFNIQAPIVRNFHKEWIFFELCKENGLATPFYDFSYVSFNGSDPMYCALEDNFGNNYVKRKTGDKAPVLRFYEDHIFPYFVYSWSHSNTHSLHFETSYIYPFNKDYYSGKGKETFTKAAGGLRDLINGNLQIADFDKWATLFAITSLTKSYHGLAWHNQRYFMNEGGKIEPIPYDGNTPKGDAESWNKGKAILGDFRGVNEYPENPMYFFQLNLMKDSAFRAIYVAKLKQISKSEYLKAFIAERQEKLNEIYEGASHFYQFDTTTNYLFNNSKKIEEAVNEFAILPDSLFENFFNMKESDAKAANIPLKPEELQAFIVAIKDGENVKLVNGSGEDVLINYDESQVELKNNSNQEIKYNLALNKLNVVQKNDSTINFEIEIVDWVPVVE